MLLKKSLFVLLLFSCATSFAQKTFELRDLFKTDTIVWFGIDYSRATFVGFNEDKDLHEYFDGWNRLVVDEPGRYNFLKPLQKHVSINNSAAVAKVNGESVPVFRSEPDSALRRRDLLPMVAKYESTQRQGIGVVLVAETYNYRKPVAVHGVVVFDIASRNILISQRYTTLPDGMGTRNYWAPTLTQAFKLLNHNYKVWKKKYRK